MLDAFSIFTKGGIVLWSFSLAALKGSPVDALIRSCLLEERAGESSYAYTSDNTGYTLKWSFNNELELVFVAVRSARARVRQRRSSRCNVHEASRPPVFMFLHASPPSRLQVFQRVLQLPYVDDLLAAVNKQFSQGHYRPSVPKYPEFEDEFRRILADSERRSDATRRPRQISNFDPSRKAKDKGKAGDDDGDSSDRGGSSASLAAAGGSSSDLAGSADASPGAFDLSKLKSKNKKGVSPAAPPAAASGGKPATDEGKKKKARLTTLVSPSRRCASLSPSFLSELSALLLIASIGDAERALNASRVAWPQKDRVWENGKGSTGAKLDFSDKPPEGGVPAAGGDGDMPAGPSAMDVEEESSTDEEEEEEQEGRATGGAKAGKSGADATERCLRLARPHSLVIDLLRFPAECDRSLPALSK